MSYNYIGLFYISTNNIGGKVAMNKTKLGVSTNLMAAFIYALAIVISFVSSGMAFTLALVVTVAYILYK